ncbi:hypothetical protein B5X24_HaOG200730 [Helicoverpa armigera]|uniref:Gustatory receptor n=1 Tax=Helicoverpa armigera TaxID=29058 RepID=A0A2W1BWA7_HELAM|nr:hypothetical protein B5X24_HaOG200730 [Helicoverpa armigera]
MVLSRRNSMSLIETNQGDVEILSNNFIDKKLERLFFPLNLMQNLVLNPKYIIKQNRIKPNDVFNKFKIFLSMVIFLAVFAYRLCEVIFDENLRRYGSVKFLYFEIYSECFVYCTRSVVNCIVNLVQSKNFVAFVLTYQEIHRILTYEHMIKFYIIRNWVYFSIVFGYYIIVLVLIPLIFERWAFHFDINVFTYIILDANLIYTIALLKHLNDKVKQWNIEVVRSPHRICSERMFQVYVQIFECYEIYKNVVQENVS